MDRKRRFFLILILVMALLLLSVIASLTLGTVFIPVSRIFKILFSSSSDTISVIIKGIRLPRIILSLFVGAGLAVAGVIFQGVIRNPMVDPYIIGISAGAGVGITFGIVLNLSWSIFWFDTIPMLAFGGALITVFIVYQLARVRNKVPVMTFLLAGVAMSFVLNAIMSFLMVIGTDDLHKIIYWIMGSVAGGGWTEVRTMLPYFILGFIPIIFYMKDLNIILLGEDSAQYLGVDVERVKKILIISASLITASVVSVSGSIGFVGLVIPHIARIMVGPDHKKLVPLAALLGGMILLISDTLARTLFPPLEIPVGIITALAGGPYFIYLLRKNKNEVW